MPYVKGIVHFKMRILSFTHPQVVSKLYDFFFLMLNTKKDILKNVWNHSWCTPL